MAVTRWRLPYTNLCPCTVVRLHSAVTSIAEDQPLFLGSVRGTHAREKAALLYLQLC